MAAGKSRGHSGVQNGNNQHQSSRGSTATWICGEMTQIKRLSTAVLAVAVLLVFGVYAWSLVVEQEFATSIGVSTPPLESALKLPYDVPPAARELIEKIKDATRIAMASGSADTEDISEEELKAWHRRNPCRSRKGLIEMYDRRRYARKVPPNPVWEEVLQEYTKLHRTCTRKVGNFTEYFLSKNESTGCRFAVTDVTPLSGLGNKILVTISSIMYAILTQRVILVSTKNLIPSYTCEPFPGSTWTLDADQFPLPAVNFSASDPWKEDKEYLKLIDQIGIDMSRGKNLTTSFSPPGSPASIAYSVTAVGRWGWQPVARFYCRSQQEFFSRVPWVYFTGCIYTLPKLFVAPIFRPTLEALFPYRLASTWILRSLMLPSDAVWDRVRRIDRTYLQDADRRVGIQVRFKDGEEMYRRMNDLVNERITDCVVRNNILPNVSQVSWGTNSDQQQEHVEYNDPTTSTKVVKVFIASLFSGLMDHLSKMYVQSPTVSGENVGFVQISQGQSQHWSRGEDMQAFTEIILLSFSDQLLVTPVSTFGGLAEAYGGLTPWYIEYREKYHGPSCQRAQTVDVCNQFTFKKYSCPREPDIHDKLFSEVVPYIKNCLGIDHPKGIQLISDFVS
ncbi:hypothetical protein R1flu_011384 [Riccia fluitans]|uniref:Fucosyltransferase n=1 Tax=Riccia fluitans TaxID=41844 RepID=A0ABD1Z7N3_9MARC